MKRLTYLFYISIFLINSWAAHAARFQPAIAGDWQLLYAPVNAGPRVNDHTVFRDAEGGWRFVGIAARVMRDLTTPYMGHAVGPSLDEPMQEMPVVFKSYPDRRPKWAPHVIAHDDTWHMFVGPGRIRHYISKDGIEWSFHDVAIYPAWYSFRDSMVLKVGEGEWLMYCTDQYNSVSVYRSHDIYKWEFVQPAFKAKKPATAYPRWLDISAAESPFVIHYEGAYYLSVCLASALEPKSYNQTLIIRSDDPLDFGTYAGDSPATTSDLVTILPVHAAEYIHAPDGRWFITTCGWETYPGVEGMVPGAVLIAPLNWEKVE
jgi:beta-fructofuranosidase